MLASSLRGDHPIFIHEWFSFHMQCTSHNSTSNVQFCMITRIQTERITPRTSLVSRVIITHSDLWEVHCNWNCLKRDGQRSWPSHGSAPFLAFHTLQTLHFSNVRELRRTAWGARHPRPTSCLLRLRENKGRILLIDKDKLESVEHSLVCFHEEMLASFCYCRRGVTLYCI